MCHIVLLKKILGDLLVFIENPHVSAQFPFKPPVFLIVFITATSSFRAFS